MDISLWKQYNNKVQFQNTKKLFFNEYFYRVQFKAPNVRFSINSSLDKISKKFDELKKELSDISDEDNYVKLFLKHLNKDTKLENLISWHNYLKNNKNLKYRIEEPHISLYTNNIDDLFTEIGKIEEIKNTVITISRPESEKAKEILMNKKIIVKKIKDFTHIIYLSDSWFLSEDEKLQVLEYLKIFENDVRIPPSTKKSLSSKWGVGGYFYCKDPGISTCISLICPGIVKNISEIEQLT